MQKERPDPIPLPIAAKYFRRCAEPAAEAERGIAQFGWHLTESVIILPQVS